MKSLNQFKNLLTSSFEKKTHLAEINTKEKDMDSENSFQKQLLDTSLRRLEFINYFETAIDKNNQDKFSLGFLLELENMKYTLQLKALDLIHSA
ncbi:hypothetical protein [Psychroserpens mesophilus]|uniref:hypothetical protein n=1 Tax=Psychroserpens mesophilus TaxID=325473 RepID=UPI00058DBEC0|nr:hypothetical protein [Psychroserpens mesophilus]